MTKQKNACIQSVSFGMGDHGHMSLMLHLDYGGSSQGFGGYSLDTYDTDRKRRVGTAWGLEWIMQLMETLKVTDFSQLTGLLVRVEADFNEVYRIGHVFEDRWFDPTVKDFQK